MTKFLNEVFGVGDMGLSGCGAFLRCLWPNLSIEDRHGEAARVLEAGLCWLWMVTRLTTAELMVGLTVVLMVIYD